MKQLVLVAGFCAGALSGFSASAATFSFTYNGYFGQTEALNATGAALANFSGPTAFTLKARFSDQNNLAPPFFPGFVAYAPTQASMSIGGVTYTVASFDDDTAGGITIALFDATNIFNPGLYGAGFINDPVADGAGVVGDFDGASPGFDTDNIGATTFEGYNGAGYLSGVCSAPLTPPCAVSPLSLFAPDGTAYDLTLSFRIEQVGDTGLVHSARIDVVPLPATLALLAGGLGLMGAVGSRRRT